MGNFVSLRTNSAVNCFINTKNNVFHTLQRLVEGIVSIASKILNRLSCGYLFKTKTLPQIIDTDSGAIKEGHPTDPPNKISTSPGLSSQQIAPDSALEAEIQSLFKDLLDPNNLDFEGLPCAEKIKQLHSAELKKTYSVKLIDECLKLTCDPLKAEENALAISETLGLEKGTLKGDIPGGAEIRELIKAQRICQAIQSKQMNGIAASISTLENEKSRATLSIALIQGYLGSSPELPDNEIKLAERNATFLGLEKDTLQGDIPGANAIRQLIFSRKIQLYCQKLSFQEALKLIKNVQDSELKQVLGGVLLGAVTVNKTDLLNELIAIGAVKRHDPSSDV